MSFMLLIGPALWASGIVYLLYDLWSGYNWSGQGLTVIAFVHTARITSYNVCYTKLLR